MGATRHPHHPQGQYDIDCGKRASLPNLTFTFSGHNFTIEPDDYIFEDGGSCISSLMSVDMHPPAGPFAVIGTVFLRKWYSVFDMRDGTIGFAQAKRKS